MISRLAQISKGSSLTAKVLRSSALTVLGFGSSQFLRLVSNLILTRLLFPEAFGMMALVSVFLMGLHMFSDVGVGPAIMQSKRGDDPDFLDTAWTIQAIRGFCLWIAACLLAWPMSVLYDAPQLALLLPVASLTLLINGFIPTRLDSANRHLKLGRVTAIDIGTQVIGILIAVAAAWVTRSVWALVISGVVSSLVQLGLYSWFLPGKSNRFRWEKLAASELINFGKWIFLSTLAGFLSTQGDKLLIGKYLPLDQFGVYNIGYFLASFPFLMGGVLVRRILIPIYRDRPPSENMSNFLKLRKMRFLVSAALCVLLAILAFLGVWLIDVLYDDRYAMAGAVVVIIACMQVPAIIVLTYDQAALAAGDSRRFFVLAAARAVLMIGCLFIGLEIAGLFGALISQGVAVVLTYPFVVWLSKKTGAWDPLHDLVFAIAGAVMVFAAFWLNQPAILALIRSATG